MPIFHCILPLLLSVLMLIPTTANASYSMSLNGNGSMTSDLNTGITRITYNDINLPHFVTFNNGHQTVYVYSCDGRKLQATYQVAVTATTSGASTYARYRTEMIKKYSGDYIYENDTLTTILFDGGYIDMRGGLPLYHFYTHDYQGNIRVSEDIAGNRVERYDYYPYGALFGETSPSQDYLYGGKEWERTYGMNHYDFHARWMNPLTTRFTTQDPLQLDFAGLSSYSYCAGNPVLYIDPTGEFFTEIAEEFADKLVEELFMMLLQNMASYSYDQDKINETANAINEIAELRASNQLYDVVEDKSLGNSYGSTRANAETGAIEIALGDMNAPLELIAHEFKHLYQFEKGEISFGPKLSNDETPNFLYDKTDEIEAYNRGALFGGVKYNDKTLPTIYNNIQKGPISIYNHPNIKYLLNLNQKSMRNIQRIANNTHHIFRINGITIFPQK